MKLRKTQLAAAVGVALLAGATAVQAQSAPVQSRDTQVQLYGQVGRVLMWADDGHRNKWFHADNEVDGTRFGVRASTQVMPGLRAGMRLEWEMQSNTSDKVTFENAAIGPQDNTTSTSQLGERFAEVILDGAWGRLNIGQGEAGADNAATRDLSNTKNSVCACDFGGGILWRNGAGAALAGSPTVGDTHSQQDFESRYDRLMYTTPSFGGFYAQVSNGQKSDTGEVNEASIWYKGKLGGQIEAAIGWSEEKTGTPTVPHNETIGGSISWLHTSGLNLTFGYTQQEFSTAGRDKGKWTWGKVGYKFGPHAVGLSYGIAEDQAANGDEGDIIGLGYTWTPVRWMDIFAVYQLFTLDRPAVSVEDISVAVIGAVVRF